MKYKEIKRESLVDMIPYTISYIEKIDQGLLGCELVIRDADWQMVLESEGDEPTTLYKEICTHTNTHCCKCGSDYLVRKVDVGLGLWESYANDGMSPFDTRLCADCHEKLYRDNVDAITLVKFQIKRCTEEGDKYKAPHKKVRLLTTDGHIVYRFVDEISVVGEEYFITPRNQESKKGIFSSIKSLFQPKREVVTILGVDTGKRDINDERIFTGDVVLVKQHLDQYEWTWITDVLVHQGSCIDANNNHIKHSWWVSNGWEFPIPFCYLTSIEILGYLMNESVDQWLDRNREIKEKLSNKR